MYNSAHRKSYSQNFLQNPALARYILSHLVIPAEHRIIEIGGGRGVLTQELAKHSKLTVIEKDPSLVAELSHKCPGVEMISGDVLEYQFPSEPFWIITNPPFQIFSQLVRHLMYSPHNPEGFLLFGQKEAIERLMGKTDQSTLSVILNSFYQLDIPHQFARTDFTPIPSVDVWLLRGYRIPTPLWENKGEYIDFIHYAFQRQKAHIGKNLEPLITYAQWKRLSKSLRISAQAQPGDLTISQWKGVYRFFREHVSPDKQSRIRQ